MALPRGMKDVHGAELEGIAYVRERFERLAAIYDYKPVWPSPLELLSTLETKSGPAIREEIYEFTDKGGRDVGLRFDFTMGLTRYVAADLSTPLPAKISSFGGVFRYDEPQKNRYRHFHQWDIEIYGRPHISQDTELVEFTARFFESLPLPVTIRLSHRSIMESHILDTFRNDTAAVSDMLRAIDKISKKPADQIATEFPNYDAEKVLHILEAARVRGSPSEVEPRLDSSMLANPAWHHITAMVDSLRHAGIDNVQIDLGVVRGLDYYTGMVFEVFGEGDGSTALAGGGRYDMLPTAFGRDIGAAGVAGGVERIAAALNRPRAAVIPVAILYAGSQTFPHAARLAASLRRRGIRIRMDVSGRSLKRQMSAAQDCRLAVIVAPQEMKRGEVIIRDMESGAEQMAIYGEMLERPDILEQLIT